MSGAGELEPLVLRIAPGSASPEQIAELLTALSDLNRMMGGSGIKWTVVPDTGIVVENESD